MARLSLARAPAALLAVAAACVLPAAAHAAPPDGVRVAQLLDAAGPKIAPWSARPAAWASRSSDYVTNELGIPYNAAPVLQMALLAPG